MNGIHEVTGSIPVWSTNLINNQRPPTEWSTVSTASIRVVGHDDVARTGRPTVNPFANEM